MSTPPNQPPDPADQSRHDPSGWPSPQQPQGGAVPQQPVYGTTGYGTTGYGTTGYGYGDPMAPYGYDPMGRPYSDKQKLIAGLLNILLPFGIGRFYMGQTGIGVAQLAVTVVTCGVGSLWSLIDGILILVNGGTDAQGRPLRD